jgi:hypothetical protein
MQLKLTRVAAVSSLIVGAIGASLPMSAQVGMTTASPLRAIGADAARRQANPPDAQTSYYANVLPAMSGDAGIDHVDAMPGYQFATLKLVMSVAPSIYASDQDISGGQASRVMGALRHLTAHVTVGPVDQDGHAVEIKPNGAITLSTLEISPSEPAFADHTTNRASEVSTAVDQAIPIVGPIKPATTAITAFRSAYHRTPPATQVAYMTGSNAFGWRWYESPGAFIEGLHHGTVLLQIAESIKSVKISVELVADWRAFGAWARTFEFTYTLPHSGGN